MLRRIFRILFSTALSCAVSAGTAFATPSTQIWIPSTDVQAFKTFHFGFDTYIRANRNADGSRTPAIVDLGLTAGVLPSRKIQAEIGFDLIDQADPFGRYPLYFNAKVATPEGAWAKWSPAVAVGGYNFGTKSDVTDVNIVYGLAAKTLPVVGRLSAGYYGLNKDAALATVFDANGVKGDESGVLLSWDRTMIEISDKLWAAVDYQGGDNAFGALNFGLSWAFAKNVSVIFGYDIYNDNARGGENTWTVQLDVNFP
jgi:hypothetical protein